MNDRIYLSLQKDHKYDAFEFDYIRDALKQPRNLGHLILGQEAWQRLSGCEAPSTTDPLTAFFVNEGKPIFDLDVYEHKFV